MPQFVRNYRHQLGWRQGFEQTRIHDQVGLLFATKSEGIRWAAVYDEYLGQKIDRQQRRALARKQVNLGGIAYFVRFNREVGHQGLLVIRKRKSLHDVRQRPSDLDALYRAQVRRICEVGRNQIELGPWN